MSTQQDIYAAGSESCPPMLNKENYVPWSSRLLRYAKSRPNGKLIHNSIINGPYVRRMIPEPGDINWEVPVNEIFYVQTDDELTEKELKQIETDNQAIQTILLGLPEDIYAAVDKGVDELKAERLTKTQDPLALMETSNNPYNFPLLNQDQPSFNQNYMQQPMPNPEDITDPTTVMNMALTLMAKAFKLNYSTPTNKNQRISSNPRNRQIVQPGMNMGQDRQMQMVGGNDENQFRQYAGKNVRNLNGYNVVQNVRNQIRCYNCRRVGHFARNCTARPRRRDDAYLQTQLLIAQKEEAGIQLQAEEYDLMEAAADLDEIKEVNANCILMANLQQASTSDGSTEVHDYENCDDNEIFNMFTQEEQYTELLEPILEPHQVPQNDNNVISEVTSVEQSGETVEQHPTNFEETRALYDSLYQNLAIEVEKVNTINRKLKETNADLTTELARFKNQEKSSWVPAFFVDSPLCGLMRTTSWSETKNLFFSYFTSSGSTLVKFMLCYESAMERQRHTQEKLDHQSFDSFPALLTPLHIEEHDAKVYTRSLFIRVQKEIVVGSWLCSINGMSSDEGCTVCIIDEEKRKPAGLPEVIDNESTSENVKEEINLHQKVTGHYKPELKTELPTVPTRTVSYFVQEFMGVKKPDKVKVKNPTGVRPKGREKQKRIKSGREISMKKSVKKRNKKLNGCGVCGSTFHNRRTCPWKNDVDVLYPAVVVPGGSDHVDGGLRDVVFGSFLV
nr:FAR1 DNA binding domain, zinc finger, SWIM-type, MULE transposase domain, FHY3/FAR1 family [Tanacetum cinerariifolium]